MKKYTVLKIVSIVVGCALFVSFALLFRMLMSPITKQVQGIDLKEAQDRFGLNDLPASACNICYAQSSVGLGGRARVLKFEAPIADCEAFALAEHQRYAGFMDNDAADSRTSDFKQIKGNPALPDLSPYRLNDLSWNRSKSIKQGLILKNENPQQPTLVIDTAQGILYSVWTD